MLSAFIICVGVLSLSDAVRAKPSTYPDGFTVHKVGMSWWDANRTCQAEGAKLASPFDDKQLDSMKSLMGSKHIMYFTGIKTNNYPGPFLSVEGVRLEKMPPSVLGMVEAIEQWDGEKCLAMNSDSILAVPCWSQLSFMCYTKPKCGTVDNGYKYEESQQRCYKLHSKEMLWADAELACVSEGAHLVVLDDTNEAKYVRAMFEKDTHKIWTGLRTRGENSEWITVDGKRVEDLYNTWYPGNQNISSPCAAFWQDMQMVRRICAEEKFPFICEMLTSS